MSDNDYLTANKLAAISIALMSDTPVSMAASLLPDGHILDTAAYRDAIRTVKKVIDLRSRVEALEGLVRELVQACGCEEENKRIIEVMHIPKNGGPPTFSDPEEHCPVCTKALAFLARIRAGEQQQGGGR